ncbi:hypothetical protein ABMA27_012894 [Loxostege sticticalis]|uniref:Endonuclease n=1 Tax=Loxostege sticticalis TaxID=481309 RepID=A0ABR3H066_LOXSC
MANPAEDLKRLRKLRSNCKSTITRLENFINDPVNLSSASIEMLEVRRDKLINTLKQYEGANLDISGLDDNDEEDVGLVEDKYYRVLGKINAAIVQLNSHDVHEKQSNCKLPSIELSTYDGKDFTLFKPFIDLFNAVIDKNQSLSNVQKLFYLRKYLQGDALSVIINLPLVNESYPEAIKLLEKRYDNQARIVTNHINHLLDLPQMQKGTASSIRSFVSDVRQQLHALKNLAQPVEKWDMLLISVLSRKLDNYTNRAYHLDRPSTDNLPTMDEFLTFLEKRAIGLEDSLPLKNASYEGRSKSNFNNIKVSNIATKPKGRSCSFCNNDHPIYSCPKFKMAPIADRKRFVSDNNLCTMCLRAHTDKCKYNFKCKICKASHNTLLHEGKPKEDEVITLHSNLSSNEKHILLPTIKVKVVNNHGQEIFVKALLDCGSQVCIIKRSLANKLNLTPMAQKFNITGLGNTPNEVHEHTNLLIRSSMHDITFSVKCHIVDAITANLPQNYFKKCDIPPHIQLADDDFNKPSEISLLLGVDFYSKVILNGVVKLENGLVLQNTLFGHVVTGTVKSDSVLNTGNVNLVSNFVIQDTCNEKLENIMKNFWLSEKLPEENNCESVEFQKAEECFKKSVKLENEHFSVDIPLKYPLEELDIGDSFSPALQRFLALEKKFETNPEYYTKYKQFIDEFVKLGHAKEVDINQYNVYDDPVYFLAHHAVLNESSKTTKLRVVFGGNLKTKNGISLNDLMLNGKLVQNDLFNILTLLRTYQFTLTCDIEKMFRMCLINEKFKPLQNILWRDDPQKPILCLQLQTVTYGLKASTFLSTRCLLELAQMFQDKYPLAAKAIKQNTYVDDIIIGADSEEAIFELKNQLIDLLKLVKYFDQIDLSKDNIIKTLGLKYDIMTDKFLFSCSITDDDNKLQTKRDILSFIGKIFDPLGLIGPIVVKTKLFMQEVWKSKVNWDSPLPPNLLVEWAKILKDLKEMGTIQIPRAVLNRPNVESVELVGFSDASQHAIGCCLFLRALSGNGEVQVNLLCAKSRVAPLNRKLTIPNLELNGAHLLAELSSKVFKSLLDRYPKIKVILYTDSQIVLAWLSSDNVKGTYVSNRVRDIKILTEDFAWSHIKGVDNPADILTRGITPNKLQVYQLWWHGPSFLSDSNFQQNIATSITHKDTELSKTDVQNVCQLHQNNSQINDSIFNKYSEFNKLQRVIALLLRFKHNCQNPNNKLVGSISPQELNSSKLSIIRHVQSVAFSKEIDLLRKGHSITSHMSSLHPFLDSNSILRVGGRLQNATNLAYDKKYPVILPKSNNIVYMLIKKEHLRLLHAGAKLVLGSLSQNYWLLNGIREVKKVVHKCIVCFRNKAVAAKQLMGSLPSPRISMCRPFQVTGIDFCGPFDIKVARVRKPIINKGYIAVFVCFSTKALHIELVSDLTTAAFLACLQRFIARRGLPSYIYCDNAKTFKGASNKLKELYDLFSKKMSC